MPSQGSFFQVKANMDQIGAHLEPVKARKDLNRPKFSYIEEQPPFKLHTSNLLLLP